MALNDNLEYGSHFENASVDTDWSGSGNPATLSNLSLTSDKNSVANKAFAFNGANSEAQAMDINQFSNWSVSMWINTARDDAYPFTNTYNASTSLNGRMGIQDKSDGTFLFFQNPSSWSSFTSGVFALGWHHIVITKNGTTYKLYIDKILQTTETGISAPPTDNVLFGALSTAAYWSGDMDEARIWSREISSSEVTEVFDLYDQESPSTGYSNKVNGVTPAKINGIAVANIAKVNGVA